LVRFFDLTRSYRIASSVNSIESNSCQGTDEEGKGFDWNAQKQGSIRKLGFNCGRLLTDMTWLLMWPLTSLLPTCWAYWSISGLRAVWFQVGKSTGVQNQRWNWRNCAAWTDRG
jgi:hypothetical protein